MPDWHVITLPKQCLKLFHCVEWPVFLLNSLFFTLVRELKVVCQMLLKGTEELLETHFKLCRYSVHNYFNL